ncbi:alpha/beta fold hydrolase [Sphingosinicellaceae bacterium]|nr:alpha/beta fold hydrolase [Sphingosinicellaceae bacterium]
MLLGYPLHASADAPADLNRQIASIREVREIALSPDAKTVATVITDATKAGGRSHIWTLSKTGSPKQITGTGNASSSDESGPVWAADGRSILYLRKAGEGAAVQRLDLKGGLSETLTLTRQGTGVAGGWGTVPAGKALVAKGFASAASGTVAVWASDPPDAKAAAKDDHHLFGQSDPVHLYLVEGAAPVREIGLPGDVRSVTWSKDGRRLLAITSPPSDDLGATNRVWLVEDGRPAREIVGTADNVQAISWLPDGRIAYVARCGRDAPIVCRDLFVQALDGSKPRNLTDGIDGSLINGVDGGSKTGPVVTATGDILVTIARRFDQQLARIRPADGRVSWIGVPAAVVKGISTNAGQTGFALLAAERGGVGAVQLADAGLRRYARLANPELQPADWQPLHARRIEWASDGHTIDGLLYLPDGAAAGQRVPLVVDAHGGPAGRFEDGDTPLVRLLLAQGWAVLHVNPRGSFGYGIDFLAAIKDDLGGADYRDLMSGVDAAIAQASLDRDRLALIGYSYGGTLASFALGRTDRFKAIVAAAPVVDQISESGTEGSSWYDRWYFGQPWRRLEAAWRQSPLAGVANAHTPLLLLHGENDAVNPLGQSHELYRALRQEGAPVELVLFPRETHHELGQNYYGYPSVEPYHGIALRQRIVDFLRAGFSGQPRAGLAVPDRP